MNIREEVVDYLMAQGFSLRQAEEHVRSLLENNEIEEFYKNMYNNH